METPKDDSNLNKDQKPVEKNIEGESEGILDSISDKKDELVNSIKETKDELSESIQEKKEGISKSFDSGVKKTKSFFKKLMLGSIVLLLVSFVLFLVYANWTYSEGTRAGNLIKISKKGYVFKTYEGQLKLGGIDLANPDEGLSDSWSFSVKNKEVFEELERLQGQKVVLKYKQINRSMPWQGDTDYFIYAIQK